jgi:hypothetical protein
MCLFGDATGCCRVLRCRQAAVVVLLLVVVADQGLQGLWPHSQPAWRVRGVCALMPPMYPC